MAYNNNSNNVQPEKDISIEWKKHDEFFNSLNLKLDEISNVGEMCYTESKYIFDYYAKIRNLFNKHYAYIQNPEVLKQKLIKCERALYDSEFRKDLSDKKIEAMTHLTTIFSQLQDLLTYMIQDFTIPELIPRPITKVKELWDEEVDSQKKVMYKTVMKMFENI